MEIYDGNVEGKKQENSKTEVWMEKAMIKAVTYGDHRNIDPLNSK